MPRVCLMGPEDLFAGIKIKKKRSGWNGDLRKRGWTETEASFRREHNVGHVKQESEQNNEKRNDMEV